MFYEVSGIVDVKTGDEVSSSQKKLSLVIDNDSENLIRSSLSEHKILILNLNPFKGSISDFYETTLILKENGELISIFSPLKIKEAFEMFYQDLNFEVVKIDSKSVPVSEEQNKAVLEKLMLTYPREIKKAIVESEVKKDDNEKKLDQIRNTINLNITEARQIVAKVSNVVPASEIKTLNDAIDELQKYKMGTNIEKMSVMFQDMLSIMEKIEIDYYKQLETAEKKNLENDFVNDLEIVQEYEKFKKSQKLKKTKAVLDGDMKYYQQTGKVGVFLKMLLVEGNRKFMVFNEIFYGAFEFAELLLLFLLSNVVVLNLFKGGKLSNISNLLIDMGLFGLVMLLFKNFRKKNILICALLFLGIGIVYYILRSILIANLAL